MNKTYLGDGLYAEFEGYQVRLFCERENGTHEVYLEPSAVNALLKFLEKQGWKFSHE